MGYQSTKTTNAQTTESSTFLRPLVSLGLALLLASSLIGGCKVGPNYHKPDVPLPSAYHDLSDNSQSQAQAQAASFADMPWWQVFQDPQLQELIRTALKQNYDLQLATERIVAARAQLAVTRSSLFPQIQGNGNFNGGKENTFQTNHNFMTSHGRRSLPVGLLRKVAPRDRGVTRPTPCNRGCAADGDINAGKRRGE